MQSFKILNAKIVNITIQQNSLPSKETGQYKSFQNISHSHWPSSSPDALPGSPPHPSSSLATPSLPTGPCPGIITITFSIWIRKATVAVPFQWSYMYFENTFNSPLKWKWCWDTGRRWLTSFVFSMTKFWWTERFQKQIKPLEWEWCWDTGGRWWTPWTRGWGSSRSQSLRPCKLLLLSLKLLWWVNHWDPFHIILILSLSISIVNHWDPAS